MCYFAASTACGLVQFRRRVALTLKPVTDTLLEKRFSVCHETARLVVVPDRALLARISKALGDDVECQDLLPHAIRVLAATSSRHDCG